MKWSSALPRGGGSTPAWRRLQRAALAAAGWRCARCGLAKRLHVHHKTPRSRGGTDDHSNLEVLCAGPSGCHAREHFDDKADRDPARAAWRSLLRKM